MYIEKGFSIVTKLICDTVQCDLTLSLSVSKCYNKLLLCATGGILDKAKSHAVIK